MNEGSGGGGFVTNGLPRMSVSDGFDYVFNMSRLRFNDLVANYVNHEDPRIFYFTLNMISQIPDKNRRKELKRVLMETIGDYPINSEQSVIACMECVGCISDWQDNYRGIVSANYTGED